TVDELEALKLPIGWGATVIAATRPAGSAPHVHLVTPGWAGGQPGSAPDSEGERAHDALSREPIGEHRRADHAGRGRGGRPAGGHDDRVRVTGGEVEPAGHPARR